MTDGIHPAAEDVVTADVLMIGDPPHPWRVIGVFADSFILFDLGTSESLHLETLTLEAFEADATIRLAGEHTFNRSLDEAQLTEKRRERRRKSFAMIQPLLDLGDDIFDEKKRTATISLIANADDGEDGKAPDRKTVIATLDRFFRFGMTASACMPSFDNIGGLGVPKTRGEKKLGRPRLFGTRPGTNLTPELCVILKIGLKRYFLKSRKMNFEDARKMILRDFCMERRIDPETRKIVLTAKPLFEEQDFLSVAQIKRFADQNEDMLGFKRERVGRKKYDRNLRGRIGSATRRAFGPGSRFEIDATIANVYVVSELEPELVIGRPVIYIVVDVFSKMIVGLYVGLEGPSWTGAMMALVNMVSPKVDFCRDYGIVITADEWPCHHLPDVLLGDRGEIASRVIESLQANRHVTVENASAYRPDWKGTVEKCFDLLQCRLAPYTDSYVEPDFEERGAKNYVLNASWTIRDVTQAMIDTILLLNNHRTISQYDRSAEMIRDKVDAIPLEMWNWGIQNLSGQLRRADPKELAFDVMPRVQVSVTARGISFSGLRYTCELAENAKWFDKAKQNGAWHETISYDPRSASYVYLHVARHVDRRGYVVCRLVSSHDAYEGRTFAEVRCTLKEEKSRLADRSLRQIEREMESATLKEQIEKRAKDRLIDIKRRPKDIKDRRAVFSAEKVEAQRREAFDFSEDHATTLPVGQASKRPEVLDADSDDVSVPSLRRRMANKRKLPE